MRAQLARVGAPDANAIGIDEISIRKVHTYRIVVFDKYHTMRHLGEALDKTCHGLASPHVSSIVN